MPVDNVSLSPFLRPWAFAGISYLLMEGGDGAATLGQEFEISAQETPPVFALKKNLSSIPPRNVGQSALPRVSSPSTVVSTAADECAPSCFPEPCRDSPKAWPSAWARWYAQCEAAPVLWTYHMLGADVSGLDSSARRSTFFRSLLKELRLPKGTSVFWPTAMPGDQPASSTLVANPGIFSAGMMLLRPQLVVVFGREALNDIGIGNSLLFFRQYMIQGKLLLVFPDVDDFLTGRSQLSSAISLFRAVVASLRLTP